MRTTNMKTFNVSANGLLKFAGLLLLVLVSGCRRDADTPSSESQKHEKKHQLLVALSERQDSTLCQALQDSSDAELQLLALRHAASWPDTSVVDCLLPLLHSHSTEMRRQTVESLGALKSHRAKQALQALLKKEKDATVRQACYPALGRMNDFMSEDERRQWMLDAPCEDAPLWMAFYAQDLVKDTLHACAIEALSCPSLKARKAAAFALSRSLQSLSEQESRTILDAIAKESDPSLKSPLIRSLRNAPDSLVHKHLEGALKTESDERLLAEYLRLTASFSSPSVDLLLPLLAHSGPGIPAFAGKLIQADELEYDQIEFLEDLSKHPDPYTQSEALLLLASRRSGQAAAFEDLLSYCSASQMPQIKANLLSRMHGFEDARPYLLQQVFDKHAVVRTAAAEALLAAVNEGEDEQALLDLLAVQDAGITALVCEHLTNQSEPSPKVKTALLQQQASLRIPEDAETVGMIELLALKQAWEFEPRSEQSPKKLTREELNALQDTVIVRMVFEEGRVVCALYTLHTPESVCSFVHLAEQSFYDSMTVHRVVPNFVIQAGCPRGDGWGGIDYTIHTERGGDSFTAGSLGMASAGPDTESSQWFITHTDTPHLDQRYTRFGEVVEGMDVVRKLRRGSLLLKVELP